MENDSETTNGVKKVTKEIAEAILKSNKNATDNVLTNLINQRFFEWRGNSSIRITIRTQIVSQSFKTGVIKAISTSIDLPPGYKSVEQLVETENAFVLNGANAAAHVFKNFVAA